MLQIIMIAVKYVLIVISFRNRGTWSTCDITLSNFNYAPHRVDYFWRWLETNPLWMLHVSKQPIVGLSLPLSQNPWSTIKFSLYRVDIAAGVQSVGVLRWRIYLYRTAFHSRLKMEATLLYIYLRAALSCRVLNSEYFCDLQSKYCALPLFLCPAE